MLPVRRLLRPARRLPWQYILPVFLVFFIEVTIHRARNNVPQPPRELDPPFFKGCQEPDVDAPRENAVFVMMARNSERAKANKAVASIERVFNKWFNYPYVFMNDEPFDDLFIETLNKTAAGKATFEIIPKAQFTYPDGFNVAAAQQSIQEQGAAGIPHAESEGYHHMCRFYSGSVAHTRSPPSPPQPQTQAIADPPPSTASSTRWKL